MGQKENELSCHMLIENIWNKLLEVGNYDEFNFGDIIYRQDKPSQGMIYFREGRIKLYSALPNGVKRTICILEEPYILGETSAIDNGMNICNAVSLAKTKVVSISKEEVREILLYNPHFRYIIMRTLAKKIRYMQTQIEDASFKLSQRLARLLLYYNEYKKSFGKEKNLILIVTHSELASCLGTTRPKITEHLNEFYRNGLIEKGKGFIKIKDYEGLKHIAGKFSDE